MPSSRLIKDQLHQILQEQEWHQIIAFLDNIPARRLISPLFSTLCSKSEQARWRGISCLGLVTTRLIQEQGLEAARVVMRRLIWSLNDESGGIGWGAPEAMGEIMANSGQMALEYHRILISYIQPEARACNYLEYEPLRQGAYWGLARLSQTKAEMLLPYKQGLVENLLREDHPFILACGSLLMGYLGPDRQQARALICKIGDNHVQLNIYWEHKLLTRTLQNVAQEALGLKTGLSSCM